MKLKLGPLENSRTFYSPKGNQTVIRDTFTPQVNPIQPEVETPVTEEPLSEIIVEESTPKTTKKTNERSTKN